MPCRSFRCNPLLLNWASVGAVVRVGKREFLNISIKPQCFGGTIFQALAFTFTPHPLLPFLTVVSHHYFLEGTITVFFCFSTLDETVMPNQGEWEKNFFPLAEIRRLWRSVFSWRVGVCMKKALCIFYDSYAASPSARSTGETLKSSQWEPGDFFGGTAYKSVWTSLRLLYVEISHFQCSPYIVPTNSSKFKKIIQMYTMKAIKNSHLE